MLYTVGVIFLVVLAWHAGKSRKFVLVLTFVFLAGIALLFEPTPQLDLYRHYETLDTFRDIGYEATVEMRRHSMGDLPVYSMLFYVISFLGHNKLLLVFTYLAIYGCLFAVLSMYIKDEKLSDKHWQIGYALIMLTTNAYALTGIRNMLAFAVVCLFMYIDLRRRKMRIISMVTYVLMCLLHDSIVIFVLFRFILYFSKIKGFKVLRYGVVLWPLLQERITSVLGESSIPLLVSVSEKLASYTTQEAAERWVSGIALEMLSFSKFVFVAIVIVYYFQMTKLHREEPYMQMLLMIALFSFGGIGSRALADRYAAMAIMYAVPFVVGNSGIVEANGNTRLNICLNSFPLWVLIAGYFLCLFIFQYRLFV